MNLTTVASLIGMYKKALFELVNTWVGKHDSDQSNIPPPAPSLVTSLLFACASLPQTAPPTAYSLAITMHSASLYSILAAFSPSVVGEHVLPGKFELAGRSGVPPMHAALLPSGNVVFLDKLENYTEATLDNGRYAYSTIYNPDTHELRPQRVPSNAFCCGGAFLADGTLVTMGGNGPLTWLDDSVTDGFDALRYLAPDTSGPNADWVEYNNVKIFSKRWYASVQTLSDGKVFIASGSLNGLDLRNPKNNNPTYELLDKHGKPFGKHVPMDILVENQPY